MVELFIENEAVFESTDFASSQPIRVPQGEKWVGKIIFISDSGSTGQGMINNSTIVRVELNSSTLNSYEELDNMVLPGGTSIGGDTNGDMIVVFSGWKMS